MQAPDFERIEYTRDPDPSNFKHLRLAEAENASYTDLLHLLDFGQTRCLASLHVPS
jgi:hypothetical protein